MCSKNVLQVIDREPGIGRPDPQDVENRIWQACGGVQDGSIIPLEKPVGQAWTVSFIYFFLTIARSTRTLQLIFVFIYVNYKFPSACIQDLLAFLANARLH